VVKELKPEFDPVLAPPLNMAERTVLVPPLRPWLAIQLPVQVSFMSIQYTMYMYIYVCKYVSLEISVMSDKQYMHFWIERHSGFD
jgi:hypothetical protein